MTAWFEWRPAPPRIAIRCPGCGEEALFAFGAYARVDDRAARARYARSEACDVFEALEAGNQRLTVVVHYGLLDPRNTADFAGTSLATGTWRDLRRPDRQGPQGLGAVQCVRCTLRRRHVLRWPADAFYRCEVRGEELWAWTREQCALLRDYVASAVRDREVVRASHPFLAFVPARFLEAKWRAPTVAALDRLLAGG